MDTLIDHVIEREVSHFIANDYRGLEDEAEFEIVSGTIPVMLSAPHAVTHWREGHIKPSDDYTGSIALALADLTGAHAIVSTRFSHADPNWDPFERSAYKQALAAYVHERGIKALLDIHGMTAASPALIALGTADGKTCAAMPDLGRITKEMLERELAERIKRYGKGISLDEHRHGARGENTVAQTIARECGIACLQIELATQVRLPSSRGMHIPKGDPAPFTGSVRDTEIAARCNPDPSAVETCVEALAALIGHLASQ